MRLARPSARAVLPTPASPTYSGLFLRRRHRIWMVRSTSSARPTSGSILPLRAISLRLLANSARASALPSPSRAFPGLALAFRLAAGFVFLALLGDAVRQVIDHVQAGHVLLGQEIHGMRVLLAEDRHQHVGAGDLLLARGLHVVDRALQHALEAQGGLGVAAVVFGQARDRGFDRLFQVVAQARSIAAAGLEHGLGRGVVQQGQQQVLHGHEFMPGLAGALVALADGLLEIFAEHGLLRLPFPTI